MGRALGGGIEATPSVLCWEGGEAISSYNYTLCVLRPGLFFKAMHRCCDVYNYL